MEPVRVDVLTGWSRSARGNAWPIMLRKTAGRLPVEVTVYHLADLIVAPHDPAALHAINTQPEGNGRHVAARHRVKQAAFVMTRFGHPIENVPTAVAVAMMLADRGLQFFYVGANTRRREGAR